MMSMDYIRRHYNVPAKRGGRVKYKGEPGLIVGSHNAHLRIRIDGAKRSICCHPTWQIEYVDEKAQCAADYRTGWRMWISDKHNVCLDNPDIRAGWVASKRADAAMRKVGVR